jgi:hypothetical protein
MYNLQRRPTQVKSQRYFAGRKLRSSSLRLYSWRLKLSIDSLRVRENEAIRFHVAGINLARIDDGIRFISDAVLKDF